MTKKKSGKKSESGGVHVPHEIVEIERRLIELLQERKTEYEEKCRTPRVHPFTLKPVEEGRPGSPLDPFPPGTTDRELDEFTSRTGVRVPESLRRWLRLTNGAPGFYGIRTSTCRRDFEHVWEHYPVWKMRSWLPVACDDFGNYYVQPGCETVCFVEALESEYVAYVVASNMLHFALFKFEERIGLHRELARSKGYDIHVPESRSRSDKQPTEIDPWPFSKQYMMFRDPELKNVKGLPTAWR